MESLGRGVGRVGRVTRRADPPAHTACSVVIRFANISWGISPGTDGILNFVCSFECSSAAAHQSGSVKSLDWHAMEPLAASSGVIGPAVTPSIPRTVGLVTSNISYH